MAAGSGTITVRSNYGGGQTDALSLRIEQVNRDAMVNMTIRQSVDEENPTPASATEVAARYFIANSADRVPVVPVFHYGTESNGADRQFPAGPGIAWSVTWDSGVVTTVEEKFAPQGLHGHSILAVSIPSMPTGTHTFTVKATLPGGKTYTSQAMSVLVYAQNIYITLEGDFKPKAPVDQAPQFIPGSALNGTSLDLRTTPQMVQLNILVGRGSSGTFSVKLSNVSRYPGITMNYPLNATDTNPDMDFGAGDLELFDVPIPKGGAPKLVKLPLYIYDYGASATIEVTMPYRKKAFVTRRRIPLDADKNGLPDVPWTIGTTTIDLGGLTATTDTDDDNNAATPHKGDGLSAIEEMRGVVQMGLYTRLNPRRRDLFLVMDPSIYILPETPVARLFTLPVMLHFIDESEVSGETYAPRGLTKTKPVINTNRTGIPGARAGGQRAVRVIHQQDVYPTVPRIDYTTGQVVNVPAYRAGIFGMTILDAQDPSRPEDNPPPGGYTAQSPDATRAVELFEETYVSAGIHTAFASGPFGYYDTNGDPTEPCIGPGDPPNCDHFDLLRHMIRPFELGEGYFDALHTIPSYSDDYYTLPGQRCDFPGVIFDGGFMPDHMMAQRGAVVAHEIGHAIDIDHNFTCGTMMSDRITDTAPLPTSFSTQERSAVRLWQ